MPVLKHARKKLKQDVNRTLENRKVKEAFKLLVKKAKVNPTKEAVSTAMQAVDKAAKKNIIHKNKAAHLKSALSKAKPQDKVVKTADKKAKKTVKKTSKKINAKKK